MVSLAPHPIARKVNVRAEKDTTTVLLTPIAAMECTARLPRIGLLPHSVLDKEMSMRSAYLIMTAKIISFVGTQIVSSRRTTSKLA